MDDLVKSFLNTREEKELINPIGSEIAYSGNKVTFYRGNGNDVFFEWHRQGMSITGEIIINNIDDVDESNDYDIEVDDIDNVNVEKYYQDNWEDIRDEILKAFYKKKI